MGTFSKSLASCGGFVAGPARGDRLPAHLLARLPVHRLGRARGGRRRAGGAAGAALARTARRCSRAVLENAWRLRDGLARASASRSSRRRRCRPTARCRSTPRASAATAPGELTIVTPIIPVLVGDDWKAALLWRALYDAGVFVNTALHPAVPPGGALLRTSVMATHDDATLDRALDVFARVKRDFEAEHGPLPGPGRRRTEQSQPAGRARTCPFLHKSPAERKRPLLAYERAASRVDRGARPVVASGCALHDRSGSRPEGVPEEGEVPGGTAIGSRGRPARA